MKKTILLLLLILTISCSNDDSNDAKSPEQQEVYMKVLNLSFRAENGNFTYYGVWYGTSDSDRIQAEVTESVYKFYENRLQNGNNRWIGEVDKE